MPGKRLRPGLPEDPVDAQPADGCWSLGTRETGWAKIHLLVGIFWLVGKQNWTKASYPEDKDRQKSRLPERRAGRAKATTQGPKS